MWRSDVHFGVPSPTVTVLLFASYADAFGGPRVDVPLVPRSTVADLVTQLRDGHAGTLPPRPLVAVNQEYAAYDRVIEPGDEIALIPPVAGG
jgi:molybdopterin converting factor small subunit